MSGKVYAIMSVVPGNGAKYVATNLARAFKRIKKTQQVLLIDFDFENPFLAYVFVKHDNTHGIDNLIPHIHGPEVSDEVFKENIISTRMSVDVLRGTQLTGAGKIKMFSRLHVESILKTARRLYDAILVTISQKSNNAGTVYTLLQADQLFLVLRNNYSNEMKLDKAMDVISHYYSKNNPVYIVYNFNNIHSKARVKEKLQSTPVQIRVVGVLDYDERTIDNIDLDRKDSFLSRSVNTRSFNKIAKLLT